MIGCLRTRLQAANHCALEEVFHVYLNKFENTVSHLFLVLLGNN